MQSGLVPGVCCGSACPITGHRKHPDSLPRSSISAHLPPQKEPGAPEVQHQSPGSELLRWVHWRFSRGEHFALWPGKKHDSWNFASGCSLYNWNIDHILLSGSVIICPLNFNRPPWWGSSGFYFTLHSFSVLNSLQRQCLEHDLAMIFPCTNRLWYFWLHPQPGVSKHQSGDDETKRLHGRRSPQRCHQCNRIQQGHFLISEIFFWNQIFNDTGDKACDVLLYLHLQLMWMLCSRWRASCLRVLKLRAVYLDGVEFTYKDVKTLFFNTLSSVCIQGFRYSVAFNSTTVHSLPMAVNILSNALLRGLNGTGQIRTWTKPFDYVSMWQSLYILFFYCLLKILNVSNVVSLSKSQMLRPTLWCT